MSIEETLRLQTQPLTMRRVAAILRTERYDGPLTLHFRGGIAQRIEVHTPALFPVIGEAVPAKRLPTKRLTLRRTRRTVE